MSDINHNITNQFLRLKATIKVEKNEPDVEKLLQNFHATHQASNVKPLYRRKWIMSAAAAIAVVVGLAMCIKLINSSSVSDTYLAYEAIPSVEKVTELTITDRNGNSIPTNHITTTKGKLNFKNSHVNEGEEAELVIIWVPYDESLDVTLPDGSQVMLYPGSKVSFPSRFEGKERKVELKGDAYFCVSRNEKQPFIVSANGIETKVLGTEFQVNASNAAQKSITLVSGSISVASNNDTKILTPNQQISYTSSAIQLSNVDTTPLTMWRDGYLYYDNMSVESILSSLGKLFNCTVVISNHMTQNPKMRFIADKHSDLESIINSLNDICSSSITYNDGIITAM